MGSEMCIRDRVGSAFLHGVLGGISLVSFTHEFCLYCGGAACERRKMIRIKRVPRTQRISIETRINSISGNVASVLQVFYKNLPQIVETAHKYWSGPERKSIRVNATSTVAAPNFVPVHDPKK